MTKKIKLGNTYLGGGEPVLVQSMLNVPAADIEGSVKQAVALEKAGCTIGDIDAVAVTYAPGLIGSLLVGVNFAKGLALSTGKPLIAVNHIRGHIAGNYITHNEFKPPFVSPINSPYILNNPPPLFPFVM